MSIFAAPSFYNQADQNIFTGGDRFITQERFRLGDPIQKNISFNSGIPSTTAANMLPPPPFVPINQGGQGRQVIPTGGITATTTASVLPRRILPFDQGDSGDDGNTIIGAKDPYAYTGPGSSKGTFNIDDIGEGTIDYDDIYYNPNNLSKADLAKLGGAYLLGGPITGIYQAIRTNKQKEAREKARLQAELDREYGKTRAQFADIRDGSAPGDGTCIGGGQYTDELGNVDYQDAYDPGGDFNLADGGRVGYIGGGIANLVDIYD